MLKENCKYCIADKENKNGGRDLYWSEPRRYKVLPPGEIKFYFDEDGYAITEGEVTRFEYFQHEHGHPELNEENKNV